MYIAFDWLIREKSVLERRKAKGGIVERAFGPFLPCEMSRSDGIVGNAL